MKVAENWKDYEIIDMANGEKLERWKDRLATLPRQAEWEAYVAQFQGCDHKLYGRTSLFLKNGIKLMLVTIVATLVEEHGSIIKKCLHLGKLNIKI